MFYMKHVLPLKQKSVHFGALISWLVFGLGRIPTSQKPPFLQRVEVGLWLVFVDPQIVTCHYRSRGPFAFDHYLVDCPLHLQKVIVCFVSLRVESTKVFRKGFVLQQSVNAFKTKGSGFKFWQG